MNQSSVAVPSVPVKEALAADGEQARVLVEATDGRHPVTVALFATRVVLRWSSATVEIPLADLKEARGDHSRPWRSGVLMVACAAYAIAYWPAPDSHETVPVLAGLVAFFLATLIVPTLGKGRLILRGPAHERSLVVRRRQWAAMDRLVAAIHAERPNATENAPSLPGMVASFVVDAVAPDAVLARRAQRELGPQWNNITDVPRLLRARRRLARWMTAWTVVGPLLLCGLVVRGMPIDSVLTVVGAVVGFAVFSVVGMFLQARFIHLARAWIERA